MRFATASLAAYVVSLAATPALLAAVTFDWAQVGNAGNAADPETGYGSVSYNYAISKHEVTNAQYTAFLNAVDPTGANALALYSTSMAGNSGGIENTGATDGARYVAQAGREQNPVTLVSFFDVMRFTNWLHNGQGNGDTEAGAYTIGNGADEVRSPDAKYWIPSEDEWYKAAYHDASAGTAPEYFIYATGRNSVPLSNSPADNAAAVNYFNDDGLDNGINNGYAVSGSSRYPSFTNPLTNVGAYTAAASPYGTFDQNGNVTEWIEAVVDSSFLLRVGRGGSWGKSMRSLRANTRGTTPPTNAFNSWGFRVATVFEPIIALQGDFNGDGVVGAIDYTVWRDGLGTTFTQTDYDVWADNYGATAGESSTAIPEPTTATLLILGVMGGGIRRRGFVR